jgi:putative heme transporter
MSNIAVGNSGRRSRVLYAFWLVTAIYIGWLIVAHRVEIDRAALRFPGAKTWWLVVAIMLEAVSQCCYTTVQHRLLRRAGTDITWRATGRLVLAQNAIGLAVPGGPVAASVFSYRQIRRRGTNASAAAWVVGATNVVGMLALALFGVFTATGTSVWSLMLGALFITALAVLVVLARSPLRLRSPAVTLARQWDRIRRRQPDVAPENRVDARLASLSAVHLGWRDWVFVGFFALGAVAADCAVWVCASHAIIALPARCLGSNLPARFAGSCARFKAPTLAGLFVAYSAGQAGLLVPFLPGGIGAVESIMTATLTAGKVGSISALSSVLLYRLVSFWSVVVVGGVMWATLRRKHDAPVVVAPLGTPIP